jgi:thymidylate synthase
LDRLDHIGVVRDSRDGPVIMFPEPTTIVWEKPIERVVFWAERDANPFFHLAESLWLLAGRNDVKFVEQFVKRMRNYSDNGKKFHGAYGHRWRTHFRKDQISTIISSLQCNKNSRRNVLDIWDSRCDLGREGFDLPCNLSCTFQISIDGNLDMVVHNRSNDAVLGALGANVVGFSILQEYIAAGVGAPMGKYWQVSSNLHCYIRDFEKYKGLAIHAPDPYRDIPRNPYLPINSLQMGAEVETTTVVDEDIKMWDQDLQMWMKEPTRVGIRSSFFLRTATPMIMAHKAYKKGKIDEAIEIIQTQMKDKSDWKKASLEWLQRRKK